MDVVPTSVLGEKGDVTRKVEESETVDGVTIGVVEFVKLSVDSGQ